MKIVLATLLAALWLAVPGTPCLAREPVTISTGDSPPWTGRNLPHKGFIPHLVKRAFNKVGVEVRFEFHPWARAYAYAESGKVQGSVYWYESARRKEKCLYSDPLTEDATVLFYRKGNPIRPWKALKDLSGYRIGATRGYTYTDQFWELAREGVLNVEVANSDLENFRKLLHGRFDVFPCELVTAFSVLRDNFPLEIIQTLGQTDQPMAVTTTHLLLPKSLDGSKKLLAAFNKGLAILRESGEYEKMYEDFLQGHYSRRVDQ